jgi:hypothetical protein
MNKMKYVILPVLLGFAFWAKAQTNVSGGIFTNTTWTLSNSPYIVTGNIVIFPGKTLTIEPGVDVQFVSDSTGITTNMIYLEVRGTLVANGTSSAKIRFRSTTNASRNDWYGLNVKSSQGGTFQVSNIDLKNSMYGLMADSNLGNSTFVFDNCVFEKNVYAVQMNAQLVYNNCKFIDNSIGQAVQYVSGSMTATNCEFLNNFCGFTMVNGPINLTNCLFEGNENGFIASNGSLSNCTFRNNIHGIGQGGSVNMSNCTFENNGIGAQSLSFSTISNCVFLENGKALEIGDNCSLTGNDISNNQSGVTVVASSMQTLSFQGNTVCGNLVYNLENQTDKNFQVNDICFCTTDSTEIENKIFDGYDDITKGLVNYSIYDDSCDQVLVSVIKVDLGGSTASLTEATFPTLVFDMESKQLMLTNVSGELSLSVYNTMGQRVKQIAVNESNQVITLDLPAGMFLATFDGQPSSESYKFLIP